MSTSQELRDIACLLRRDSLEMTTKAGSGHPTTCLSAAEIMSVLFFDEMRFNPADPRDADADEFVLSKGHAAPILYAALKRAGCVAEDPMTLRTLGSPFEGHPRPGALAWVKVATGSLGQGLSVGVGMALAIRKQGRRSRVYVLLGDGELAEGSVFEAMELGAFNGLGNLCAVADINRLGQSRPTMLQHDLEAYRRRFEGLGWHTVVLQDGHDVEALRRAFAEARGVGDRPTVIVARTLKGKGVSFLEDRDGFHGTAVAQRDLARALAEIPAPAMPRVAIREPERVAVQMPRAETPRRFQYRRGEQEATRAAYGKALARLAEADPLIIALDGDVSNSTKSDAVLQLRPDQYVEGFIAEQNLVGMALGMAVKGFKPFVSSFAAFLTRAHDQIRMAAYSDAHMTFVGSHAGVSIGQDGPSQMGLEDLAMFRAILGSTVLYPSDAVATERLVEQTLRIPGLKYIRTSRPKTPILYDSTEEFPVGDFKVVRQSDTDSAVLVGAGVTLHEALKAADLLRGRGVAVAVVDCYSVKPFPADKFARLVERSGRRVVVAEDHFPEGGIGEMIRGALSGTGFEVICLAVGKMPRSAEPEALLAEQGIDAAGIARAVEALAPVESRR